MTLDKGKVESGVGHAQKTPLKGMRFESPQEAQAYLDHWEARWADTRIHGTTKRQVAAMFAEERPALLPLPVEPFRYYQYGERTVHLDGCVEVEAAYYGAPPGWIGRRVSVQWDVRHVRLLPTANGLTSMPRPCSSPATPASAPARLRSYKTESSVGDVQRRMVRSRGMLRSKFAPHSVQASREAQGVCRNHDLRRPPVMRAGGPRIPDAVPVEAGFFGTCDQARPPAHRRR